MWVIRVMGMGFKSKCVNSPWCARLERIRLVWAEGRVGSPFVGEMGVHMGSHAGRVRQVAFGGVVIDRFHPAVGFVVAAKDLFVGSLGGGEEKPRETCSFAGIYSVGSALLSNLLIYGLPSWKTLSQPSIPGGERG